MTEIIRIHDSADRRTAISRGVDVLRNDGVIVYPTDTVYGLGCVADSAKAVERIRNIKGREADKPFLYVIDSVDRLDELVAEVSEVATRLIKRFWRGPLTLIFRAKSGLQFPGIGETIALRLPESELSRALVEGAGVPLVSTSVNRTGEPSADTLEDIVRLCGDRVDLILYEGQLTGAASTIVDVSGATARIIREGAVSTEALLQELGRDVFAS